MDFENTNKFAIQFQDGTWLKSEGSSSSIRKPKIVDELNWISLQINSQLAQAKRDISEVKNISIQISFQNKG
jgi:hypothetical protein